MLKCSQVPYFNSPAQEIPGCPQLGPGFFLPFSALASAWCNILPDDIQALQDIPPSALSPHL